MSRSEAETVLAVVLTAVFWGVVYLLFYDPQLSVAKILAILLIVIVVVTALLAEMVLRRKTDEKDG